MPRSSLAGSQPTVKVSMVLPTNRRPETAVGGLLRWCGDCLVCTEVGEVLGLVAGAEFDDGAAVGGSLGGAAWRASTLPIGLGSRYTSPASRAHEEAAITVLAR